MRRVLKRRQCAGGGSAALSHRDHGHTVGCVGQVNRIPSRVAGVADLVGAPPTSRQFSGTKSIMGGGSFGEDRTVELVNDSATPGANKAYKTNPSGVKG